MAFRAGTRYVFYVDNRWVKMTKEAFKHHYTILKDKMLYETFDNMRPSKIYVTYTFNDALPNTMNLMREQDWVKPDLTATDFNENFDGLFNSLAGGKAENKTHIERVVVWKYLYPEDYTIPSLNFSGAGNIGKNIFVEKMLGNLFSACTKSHFFKNALLNLMNYFLNFDSASLKTHQLLRVLLVQCRFSTF